MLHVYTGREDIDKQRYMFERIRLQDLEAERKRRIFLIVPDQFTLETERSAFTYMNVSAFINPVVLSMNRLAGKVLSEAGENTDHIDLYGKYMLLARLLYRSRGSLELFRNLENSTAFISQLSEAIMSLKTHLITPEKLSECAAAAEADPAGGVLLGKKLRDLAEIYTVYEEALRSGIPDSTDKTLRFSELIKGSKLLKDSIIWFYGFDYFSPLQLSVVGAMAAYAREVNVILTAEPKNTFFTLTNKMITLLKSAAESAGAEAENLSIIKDAAARGIDVSYLPEDAKPPEIAHIERTLYTGPVRPYEPPVISNNEAIQNKKDAALRLVVAGSFYSEAEAAAQAILRLVKDEGFRWRDILVICNDQDKRAQAIRRVFSDKGIETFMDKRYEAGHNPVLTYISVLPELISRKKRPEDVLRWLGTGLTDISEADLEDLENHIARYGLRNYRAEENVSAAIKYVQDMIALFSKRFSAGGKSAKKRTEGLKKFLEEDARLPEKIGVYAGRLEEEGFLEYAAQMKGIWDVALGIFSQVSAAIGDVETSTEEYATILKVGFASVLIGVLPASSDAVTIGTMQRTRTGNVKAMFVLGANDGELPMFAEDDGLLDDTEREALEDLGITAFRREENLHSEEQLGIYRNLSKPSRLLYLSYTAFSQDGKRETKPSRVFDRLRALFPDIPLEKDRDAAGTAEDGTAGITQVSSMKAMNTDYSIGPERMKALIPKILSPTSIEKYSRCPFAFLMDRGLKLGSIRKHEIDSRGIGDVYHEVLKRFGEFMNEKGGAPAEPDSAWSLASREDTDAVVDSVFHEVETNAESISDEGALLFEKDDPAAVYRLRRLKSAVKNICWALTESARDTGAERMVFESGFGRNGEFDLLEVGDEGLGISGRIDRIDVLPGKRAKVIDYKSGYESFNYTNVRNGWQLQLMIYLKAIEKDFVPSGVSYFRLFEPSVDITDKDAPETPEEIAEAILDLYRSDGIAVGEEEDGPKRTKAGEKILSKNEFDELRAEADKRLHEIAEGLASGNTPADPLQKAGGERITACTYCEFLSICNYETT